MAESESRVIKKYPNRRLYDTAISKYITLADVKRLVLDQVPFVIQDAKSEEDITRTILLQIILEQEEGGQPIFTSPVLEQLIRFYDGSLQNLVGGYLEHSFKLLTEQQYHLNNQWQQMISNNPMVYMQTLAEHNMRVWQETQERFFKNFMEGLVPPPVPPEKK